VNVLRGEMSIVGPRPERPFFVEQLKSQVPGYERRLAVKPGITGLAQVRAGYDQTLRDVRRKVRLDCLYIRRMCWWVDLTIVLRTVMKVLTKGTERRDAGAQREAAVRP
jgi:lipopolysaccharide/colanic/teichoic acid biosynthesis glycosyltransferase